jgi:hypothetical protein
MCSRIRTAHASLQASIVAPDDLPVTVLAVAAPHG